MLSLVIGPLPAAWRTAPHVSQHAVGRSSVLATSFHTSPPQAVRLTAAVLSVTSLCAVSRVSRRSRGGARGGEEYAARLGPDTATAVTEEEQKIIRGTMQDLLTAAGAVTAAADDVVSGTADGISTHGKSIDAYASEDNRWVINLLYDGDCHLCMKQVEFLTKRMDENPEFAGLVRFTNLADSEYDPATCGGIAFEDGMRHIHAVTRDGEVVTGVEVFRRVYAAIGMEWVYNLTKMPFMGGTFDWLYDVWAEHRLHLTGREDVIEKVRQHQQKIQELSNQECEVECEIDWDNL